MKTNAAPPVLSVITPIALDHREYLGETLAAIAGEKAGIFRSGVPALSAEPACDATDGARESVSIAATGPERRPWSLTFRRTGPRWRLIGASIVSP